MAVDINADVYASKRLNIFFPGVVPSLDGQCVSLVKWFMGEMSSVPNWNAARGDARYVGDTLVNQGHAYEVPYDQRKRGDIVVYKYGTYGHIGILLSGDRLFEQNVNVPGVASKIVDGARVYASRIGSLGESWRPVRPNIYRLRTYAEQGNDEMKIVDAPNWFARCNKTMMQIRGRQLSRPEFLNFVGRDFLTYVEAVSDNPEADNWQTNAQVGAVARRDQWDKQIYGLQDQLKGAAAALTQANQDLAAARAAIDQLDDRPTQEQLQAVNDRLAVAEANAAEAKKKYDELAGQVEQDQATGNAFLRWLGDQLNKLLGKG